MIIDYFSNMTIDRIIEIVNMLVGLLALFLGGTAYRKCKINKNALNDKKTYGDHCEDYSQKAGGDIVNNNGITSEQLTVVTNTLADLNRDNFSQALDMAYTKFQEQCDDNLASIIEKTGKIIQENKLEIGSYTKIDWIHIYFESAKNSSDQFMQDVWARVLAQELSCPNSFSYKTIDVLKNMSSEDFKLFENLCSFDTDGYILQKSRFYDDYGLYYYQCLKLQEQGIINLVSSQKTYTIIGRQSINILYYNRIIVIGNPTDKDIDLPLNVFVFSTVATELKKVATISARDDFIKAFADEIYRNNNELHVTIHEVNSVDDNTVNYQLEDWYATN